MTSHMNYILIYNAGEMMKTYWLYMAPWKDVLGYIASQRDVLGIDLKIYD